MSTNAQMLNNCIECQRKTAITVIFHFSRWLCNPQIDTKTRKWAIEGLAYLTNDADVKDDFVEDEAALQAMFELAKV